jgi:hypothetical protein
LEADAVSINDYEPGVVPGLLQTPAYARALHEGALPRLSPQVIDQRIEERQTRQKALGRESPPTLAAIMDEAVLRRPVGGAAVMSAQLERVINASGKPNVSIQIVPFGAGAHPALDSTFTLLRFLPPVPAVVYVEGLVGQMYLERRQDVERYERVFEHLRTIALNEEESVEFIQQVIDRYKSG